MTISEADRHVGFLLVAARKQKQSDLEALRDRLMQQMFDTRRACEDVDALYAGSGPGQVQRVHPDQEHAQWVLCAAVKDIEDVDVLLQQAREEK
ncbi:hypothetical protein IWX75_002682 [Arthrobacter sp. CAN_A6]|uniref:hypothetical protein n=1 Tax=Arthrobacter sp. CAN_A6 TaxID=2787721 RepID=UPI0018CA3365